MGGCLFVVLLAVAVSALCIGADAATGHYESPPVYTNSWAVQVDGGLSAADALATKYGFVNKGQVRESATLPPGCAADASFFLIHKSRK